MPKRRKKTIHFFLTDENGVCWANTGDCGILAEDEELVVYGRLNTDFDICGKKILPYEIEELVLDVDDVLECKAVKGENVDKIFLHIITKKTKTGKKITQEEYNPIVKKISERLDCYSKDLSKKIIVKLRKSLPIIHFSKIDLRALKNEEKKSLFRAMM